MKASRIVLASVGCVAMSGFLILIGSGKESRAQSKPATAATDTVKAEAPPLAPGVPQVSVPDSPLPPPSSPDPLSLPPEPPSNDLAPPTRPAATENDPEQAAREFVEKNQKIAETELATLKKEAEALQSRLRKVEAAIRRWEAVAHALKQSEGVVSKIDGSWKAEPSPHRGRMVIVDEPSDLEPIPQTKAIVDPVLP